MASIQCLPAELLDLVLQHLSQKDLILDQRVCRQWCRLIQTSPQVQRIMYLGFIPPGRVRKTGLSRFVHDNTRTPPTPHQRRQSEAKLDKSQSQIQDNSDRTLAMQSTRGPLVRFNPVFPSEGEVIRMRTMQFRTKPESPESWLDMYLTQPPCSQADATVYYKRSSSCGIRIFGRKRSDTATCVVHVVKPDGVRARDVLNAARDSQAGEIQKWQRIDICVPGVVRD